MNVFRLCFFAEGMFVVALGVVLLFVDQFVTVSQAESANSAGMVWTSVNEHRQYVFNPPDWLAYALISAGAVTVLYTVALPRRSREPHHHHG